jgi:hypothetical protein
MNCKPGDLAVMVKSEAGNEGRIVRCLSLTHASYRKFGSGPAWFTEPMLKNEDGKSLPTLDVCLRPIRPGDISDEEVRDLYAPPLPKEWQRAYDEAYGGRA